ncbi:RNA-binding protein 48-like [Rhodnius prolixus]|uniref:RNA-binding protein 48-like n=1 Tax=Rhodnius prolixus TaxID=13249 RepID=UPI003D18F3CB
MNKNNEDAIVLPHHVPEEFCRSRAIYRQGKKLTAVKVYTVSKESSHLLIFNVPAINLSTELRLLCERFGKLALFEKLAKGIELEEFTDVFHVNYLKEPSARYAKKFLDNRSFYGGFLHVCYAPEKETLEETRLKLITRRNEIAVRTGRKVKTKSLIPSRFNKILKKRPAILESTYVEESGTSYLNLVPNLDNQKVPQLASVPPTLIPVPILKKKTYCKEEPPKKIPRIVFHKNNNSE